MIFVQGTMTMGLGDVDAFEADYRAMRDKVLAEDGCLFYSLHFHDADKGIVHVCEQWTGDDALNVHFTQPWILEFFAKHAPHMLDTTVQIWDIAGDPRPLPDM